ncbi:MAG: hypothetical protein AUH33_04810 [Chloroflexi bacterium 13_1_40CM_68_21]|nr:MAG: hypothetical protein AUH33_04810 [Chloroflexi bacterium 13_1_40CM_68_21]
MRRIAVIGKGGGGRSTLCRALRARLGLPVRDVDEVQWLPGWQRAPLDETPRTLDTWAAADSWIIDGFGPWPVIDRRMERADTIVYVDFPLRTHLWSKLVHLRSPGAIARWLAEVPATTDRVVRDIR